MTKPVIAFIVGYFPIAHGGAELQTYQIANEIKENYNVHFISICDQINKLTIRNENGFTLWLLPKRKISRHLFNHNEFLNFFLIKRILTKIKPDYVYQRCAGFHTWICGILKNHFNYRFTFHMAADFDVQPVKIINFRSLIYAIEKNCVRKGLKHADHVFVQNEVQKNGCETFYHRTDSQLVYNFSYPLPHPIEKTNSKIQVTWVANIKPMKKPEIFVEIAKHFANDQRIKFTMIGTPGQESIMNLINQTKQDQSNFEYLGHIPNEEVNTILEHSHLLINTSDFEGFSNVFVQAWFRGCAVASLNANPDKIITKYSTGYCANGSYEQLISFIETYLNDTQLQQTLSNNALQFANEHLSATNVLPQIIKGITGK